MCRCGRERRVSASDGIDNEWAILEPLIPGEKPGGRPQEMERRDIVNGILSVLRRGCPWRVLPHDFPNGRTVSLSFREWKLAGIWEQVNTPLRRDLRVSLGRDPEPRAAMLDSQSIKSSSVRGEKRGDDGGKKIRGRKRHRLVDTQGLLNSVTVREASLGDREGGREWLLPLVGTRPRLQVIWGESGSAGEPFKQWVKEHLGVRFEMVKHPWTGLRGVWAPEGATIDWDTIMPKGFHLLPRRWVVERTTAWITHCRRLSRDFEGTHSSSEAFLSLAISRLMVARLARAGPSIMAFCTHSQTSTARAEPPLGAAAALLSGRPRSGAWRPLSSCHHLLHACTSTIRVLFLQGAAFSLWCRLHMTQRRGVTSDR
jgi:putative transposase